MNLTSDFVKIFHQNMITKLMFLIVVYFIWGGWGWGASVSGLSYSKEDTQYSKYFCREVSGRCLQTNITLCLPPISDCAHSSEQNVCSVVLLLITHGR